MRRHSDLELAGTYRWRGTKQKSLDELTLDYNGELKFNGVVDIPKDGGEFSVTYSGSANAAWQVTQLIIRVSDSDKTQQLTLTNENDEWYINGSHNPQFNGILFCDISVTPFTNLFPIQYFDFKTVHKCAFEVLYIDALKLTTTKIRQRYTLIAENTYLYENLSSSYQALIQTLPNGLPKVYHGSFVLLNQP